VVSPKLEEKLQFVKIKNIKITKWRKKSMGKISESLKKINRLEKEMAQLREKNEFSEKAIHFFFGCRQR